MVQVPGATPMIGRLTVGGVNEGRPEKSKTAAPPGANSPGEKEG